MDHRLCAEIVSAFKERTKRRRVWSSVVKSMIRASKERAGRRRAWVLVSKAATKHAKKSTSHIKMDVRANKEAKKAKKARKEAEKEAKKARKEAKKAERPHVECTPEILEALCRIVSDETRHTMIRQVYSDCDAECRQNGKLSMDIGKAREKALIDVLGLDGNVDTTQSEDFYFQGVGFSVKHSSSTTTTPWKRFKGTKANWTSDTASAYRSIEKMLDMSLPMLFVSVTATTITFFCVSTETIKRLKTTLGENSYKHSTGTNNRGVIFSDTMLQDMFANLAWSCVIHGYDHTQGKKRFTYMLESQIRSV
jgi:Restriction endonuclease ThaI